MGVMPAADILGAALGLEVEPDESRLGARLGFGLRSRIRGAGEPEFLVREFRQRLLPERELQNP